MNFLDLLRALFALAFTLGIIGLAAWAARRYAPQLMARLSAERGERRMTVVETLMLDPARRPGGQADDAEGEGQGEQRPQQIEKIHATAPPAKHVRRPSLPRSWLTGR